MRDTICSDQTTNVVLTASCLNVVYTWTASLATGNVTGFSDGSGNLIAQTLTNTLGTTGSVKYTVHTVAGTCIGNDTDYYVYVKPSPLLSNSPPNKAICNNTSDKYSLDFQCCRHVVYMDATGSTPQVSGSTSNNTPFKFA